MWEKPRFFYIVGSRDEVGSKDKKSYSSVEPKDEGRVNDEVGSKDAVGFKDKMGSKDAASNGSRDEVADAGSKDEVEPKDDAGSKDEKSFSSGVPQAVPKIFSSKGDEREDDADAEDSGVGACSSG
ncbi:hypothetical protein NUW54_g11686 [Trametes sanguinea]|uniref:Uncharacterized protein n=1 Tax=Trametes sanguinea TaxID=158606 RepID=A0ACC1NA20_9APHY|nr:hypothetical protein NUW54_g11686 [Trametes sanguinea]